MYNKTRKKKSNMSSHIRVEARVREVRRCVFVSHYYVKNRKKKKKKKKGKKRIEEEERQYLFFIFS